MKEAIYERELLFLTDNEFDAGIVDAKLIGTNNKDRMVMIVSQKSDHDLYKYVETIIKSLDAEMFSRIKINLFKSVDIIFESKNGMKKIVFESENSIVPYHFVDLSQEELDFIGTTK